MDLDRDDYLSAPEFRDGVRSKQVSASHLFQSVDEDRDGAPAAFGVLFGLST